MSALSGFVLVLLGFGFLIFVHELGHFLAAKWAGIRADGFAIGMGPCVASYRRGVGLCFGSADASGGAALAIGSGSAVAVADATAPPSLPSPWACPSSRTR